MRQRIAFYGGSYNPPAPHHREVVRRLAAEFDLVIAAPCGPRPDKRSVEAVSPVHRAALVDLGFRGLPSNVRVDLSDLNNDRFTPTWELHERYRAEGDVKVVIGSDLVDSIGQWYRGADVWRELDFRIIERPDYRTPSLLPPRHDLMSVSVPGCSSDIRRAVFEGEPFAHMVDDRLVTDYIERYGLYRGGNGYKGRARLAPFRPFVVSDPYGEAADRVAAEFGASVPPNEANCIVVVGGDGTLINAVRRHWRCRLPFFGVNTGHRGHLLNEASLARSGVELPLDCRLLPLLDVTVTDAAGVSTAHHAVNDAWLERAAGQAAWLELSVNGEVTVQRLMADGALVATPAGSTAYARALGATPLPADARALLLVGSNVFDPAGWKSACLPDDAVVVMRSLAPDKRPVRAFVDGVDLGIAVELRARISRTAAFELAFLPERNLDSKLIEGAFPSK